MDAAINKKICDYFATQPVLKAWVFGSYARGEEREDSDIDLLVLVEDGALLPFAERTANRDKKLIYERKRA